MRRYLYAIGCLTLLTACAGHDDEPRWPDVPEGMVEVRLAPPGTLTASPASPGSNGTLRDYGAGWATRSEENFVPDEKLLANRPMSPLPEGATLWLLIEEVLKAEDSGTDAVMIRKAPRAYVLKGSGANQTLHPCKVDKDGNVLDENVAPLYLPSGTYKFMTLSPAKAFVDEEGNPIQEADLPKVDVFRKKVANGEYLISNDGRYTQTMTREVTIAATDANVRVVELPPLINQTAQLKFTVYCDPNDRYIHNVKLLPAGVEISGLQNVNGNGADGKFWNWSPLLQDTLVAYPGNKDERLFLREDNKGITHTSDKEIVIETAVLPTDATSSSIIVLFNLKINDMPTQYEMMLNRKILRAAFSYHYKGKLTMEDGIFAIEWQNVSWNWDEGIEI